MMRFFIFCYTYDMQSLHLLQARYWDSPLSLESARFFVQRKCSNMRNLLNYYYTYRKSISSDHAQPLYILSQRIWNTEINIQYTSDRIKLMLSEGRATRIYWNACSLITKREHWKRVYPHANDPLNSALNIGYTMLANILREQIKKHGLSCEIGFLHSPQRAKEALLYDFEELFRQPVVDAAILPLFSRIKHDNTVDQKNIVRSILHHCEKPIRYRKAQWSMKTILDAELEFFISALKNQRAYIPYQHSWSHWTKK
jgi:CRISPR-associated endonuclease Cas1